MAELVAQKPVCEKCGSDVREGTTYCYNCGAPVATGIEEAIDPAKTLVTESDGHETVAVESTPDRPTASKERFKNAAKERKKARVISRKPVEYRWEPADDLRYPLIWAVIVTLVVAVIAGLMVFWK